MTDTAPVDAASVDTDVLDPLLDLDGWARDGAPFDWFARRRGEGPVWRHPTSDPGGPTVWSVLAHEPVVALGRCPHALSSDQERGGVTGLGIGDELQEVNDRTLDGTGSSRAEVSAAAKHLLTLDPPEHTAYRKIVNRGFTPRQIGLLEPTIGSLLADLLDRHPPGEAFDFTTEVSMPLPVNIIARMIGSPPENDVQLLRWSNEAVASTDPEYSGGPMSQLSAVMALIQHFNTIRDERRVERRDDLISLLLDAEVDGESLTDARLLLFLVLLTAAGNETTRTAFSHAVVELAQRPEQWQRLRDDPSLIPLAVEEVLRYSSPVLYFRRNAVDDMDIAGTPIAAGDIVALWYASANRDESIFASPDEFDVGRDPNPHVAFGGGGPHFCLGASLARLEIRVLLERLVERYSSIEVVGPVERMRSNFLHGIKHLPVVLRAS